MLQRVRDHALMTKQAPSLNDLKRFFLEATPNGARQVC
jgi:hypothetical protein